MLMFFKRKMDNSKVYYSCVIDNHPKFYWQGYIFVTLLINMAKVKGERIFVHLTESNIHFEKFLKENNVNVKHIDRWGDEKYCNKLQQLETPELRKADYVFFCDSDIAITEDLTSLASINRERVIGKTVDFPNPSLEQLQQIYDICEIGYPDVVKDTLTGEDSFSGNFNGGLYGIPGKYVSELSSAWKCFAEHMLSSDTVKNILAEKIIHTDQIAFSLALNKLELPRTLLGYEYNCPTHIKDINLLNAVLKKPAKVIHYHSSLNSTGLLIEVSAGKAKNTIKKINNVLKNNFDNTFFWNYRYSVNLDLGSGVGSRGETAKYKLDLLRNLGVEHDESVLDIGCGDLEIISNLKISNYTGVDVSDKAIELAKHRFPERRFYHAINDKAKIPDGDTVICLDVLIHQPDVNKYQDLMHTLARHTKKRLIVSGYEKTYDSSHMCFFYEDLRSSLEKLGCFKYIFKVGSYRGLSVFVADKGKLQATENKNDITNDVLADFIASYDDKDLLLETVACSRAAFGWYTKHYPRMYEYPWLLKQLDGNLEGKVVADFGAGVTPLPLLLAGRGATVITVDNHKSKHSLNSVHQASEWGFFDYSVLDESITSLNKTLDVDTFEPASVDVWYSISVVEHMPAIIRREMLRIMSNTLKPKGKILLTLDLVKNQTQLWNRSEGKVVESEQEHGDLDTIVSEFKDLGFVIEYLETFNMPETERVDLAMLVARKN